MAHRTFFPGLLAWMVLSLAAPLPVPGQGSEEEALERGRKTPAAELDAALPRTPFGAWFARLMGPKAKLYWEMNDCGEQTGDPAVDSPRDIPVCVAAAAQLEDGREISVVIQVGTWEKGLTGKPVVRDLYWTQEQIVHPLRRLSELPALLRSRPEEAAEQEPQGAALLTEMRQPRA